MSHFFASFGRFCTISEGIFLFIRFFEVKFIGKFDQKTMRNLFCVFSAQGYSPPLAAQKAGYPLESCEQQGALLLLETGIQKKISSLRRRLFGEDTLLLAKALLLQIAFGEEGQLSFSKDAQLTGEVSCAGISEIRRPSSGGTQLKFCDRLRALELLVQLGQQPKDRRSVGLFRRAERCRGRSRKAADPAPPSSRKLPMGRMRMPNFVPFSEKQLKAMTWWCPQSPDHDKDAIICDGAVRSGKTLCMSVGFVSWAMASFQEQAFAMCGKTVLSLRRNVVSPLLPILNELGFSCRENLSRGYIEVSVEGRKNRFYLFGGRDESSAALIQGVTLAGVLFDEVALMPRSFVEQALARCSVNGSKFWFNCNPQHPQHWFYTQWILKASQKNALVLHFVMGGQPFPFKKNAAAVSIPIFRKLL